MIFTLLAVTLVTAILVSFGVAMLFRRSLKTILNRILTPELAVAWFRYITFAVYVVGVSGGVRIWEIEKYITPRSPDEAIIVLNSDRWLLELYRTVIATLQSTAWMLLVVFAVALIAVVIVRGQELKHGRQAPPRQD
ncbi:MAG TPA: hypothetical protein VF247_06675 [Candidatus Krumholzibacteria bacterium]